MSTTSTKIVFTALDGEGKSRSFSYKYADEDVSSSDVRAAATAIITNGSIFTYVPVRMKSAKTVTTTEVEYDLSA